MLIENPLNSSAYSFPILECFHIVGFALSIGTIAIVYESRPNVTVEAAVLALKAGNGAVLRGGKESLATNRMLADLIGEAMEQAGAPPEALFFVPTPDREVIRILKHSTKLVDLIIPRGGAALKEAISETAG